MLASLSVFIVFLVGIAISIPIAISMAVGTFFPFYIKRAWVPTCCHRVDCRGNQRWAIFVNKQGDRHADISGFSKCG